MTTMCWIAIYFLRTKFDETFINRELEARVEMSWNGLFPMFLPSIGGIHVKSWLSADLPGKERQEKKENGEEKKENQKREGGKLTMEGGKLQNDERTFFSPFAFHFSKPLKFGNLFWVYQNGNFLLGKSISLREKKSGKMTVPPPPLKIFHLSVTDVLMITTRKWF